MATTTETGALDVAPAAAPVEAGGDVVSVIHIGPRGLDHYLRAVRGQPHNPLIQCDGRSIQLVSPGANHERAADRLDTLVKEVVDAFQTPARPFASTFYRLPREQTGVMPDKSYYIQNVGRVRGARKTIDLTIDPPPDLVIAVSDTHDTSRSLAICQSLGVPEVWVYEVRAGSLRILHLGRTKQGKARYVTRPLSLALPFLRADDIAPWADDRDEDEHVFLDRLRTWVRDVLVPRVRPPGDPADG